MSATSSCMEKHCISASLVSRNKIVTHGDPVGKAAQERTENTECKEAALVQHCLLTTVRTVPLELWQ